MAITDQTLATLCDQGYGPVRLERDESRYLARTGDRTAELALDGATVRIEARRRVAWPEADPEIDARLRIAVARIALKRPELVTVDADRGTSEVGATVWIDAARSEPHDLAVAVRTAMLLVELAATTVGRVQVAGGAGGAGDDGRPQRSSSDRLTGVPEGATTVMGIPPAAAPSPAAAFTLPASTGPAGATPLSTPIPQAAAAPAQQPAPTPTPAAAAATPAPGGGGWTPTHVLPPGGTPAWAAPDARTPPVAQADGFLEVQLIESRGGWAQVVFSNGWVAWVAASALTARGSS